MDAAQLGLAGNDSYRGGQFDKAVELYSGAIRAATSCDAPEVAPEIVAKYYGNRAQAKLQLREFEFARSDASASLNCLNSLLSSEHDTDTKAHPDIPDDDPHRTLRIKVLNRRALAYEGLGRRYYQLALDDVQEVVRLCNSSSADAILGIQPVVQTSASLGALAKNAQGIRQRIRRMIRIDAPRSSSNTDSSTQEKVVAIDPHYRFCFLVNIVFDWLCCCFFGLFLAVLI